MALVALQRGAVFHELHGSLTGRTGKNLEQFGIDSHSDTIPPRLRGGRWAEGRWAEGCYAEGRFAEGAALRAEGCDRVASGPLSDVVAKPTAKAPSAEGRLRGRSREAHGRRRPKAALKL